MLPRYGGLDAAAARLVQKQTPKTELQRQLSYLVQPLPEQAQTTNYLGLKLAQLAKFAFVHWQGCAFCRQMLDTPGCGRRTAKDSYAAAYKAASRDDCDMRLCQSCERK